MGAPRKKKTIIPDVSAALPATASSSPKARLTGTQALHLLSVVGILASLAAAFYFRSEYRQAVAVRDPASETRELVATVGEFLELPAHETPTLATVTDRSKLAADAFFAPAENGDKILIYEESRKAIIYRPSTGKLVNVAVLGAASTEQTTPVIQEPAPSDAPAPESVPEESPVLPVLTDEEILASVATVALYNGSRTAGVTNQTETDIVAVFQNISIAAKEKAARKDYTGTLVIDLSGNSAALAAKLAETIGGTVGTLPSGETNPGTDLLVIIGNK